MSEVSPDTPIGDQAADVPGAAAVESVEVWFERVGPPYPERVDSRMMELVDRAVAVHPQVAALWIARGDLVQLYDGDDARWPATEAMQSYTRAVEVEPVNPDGYEELGIWLEIHDEDRWDEAAVFLDEALARGAGPYAYIARARIHAATGGLQAALELLGPRACPFAMNEDVRATRRQIEDGDWS